MTKNTYNIKEKTVTIRNTSIFIMVLYAVKMAMYQMNIEKIILLKNNE